MPPVTWSRFLVLPCMLLTAAPCGAAVYRVKADAPGPAHDGLSWATAFSTLQSGLGAAQEGDEVWVAAGTYVENAVMRDGVALYGGFAGTETDRDARVWSRNPTVLDGGGAGSVLRLPDDQRVTSRSAIDGFTIRNGRAPRGGGLFLADAWITVGHCIIRDNEATGAEPDGLGGGIYGPSEMILHNNLIVRNRAASKGSAVFADAGPLTLIQNTIADNAAPKGAVYLGYSDLLMVGNIVAFNGDFGIFRPTGPAPRLYNNDLFGHALADFFPENPTGLNGSISLDPRFADRTGGDYRLPPRSPCIDAGWAYYSPPPSPKDLDGLPRSRLVTPDMGAYESTVPRQRRDLAVAYVRTDGDDDRDGATWETALRTVPEGVEAARDGGEVWVAAGSHVGRIVLRDGVSLYGGFAGTETERDARNPGGFETTLLGGLVAPAGVTARTVLEGFTIRDSAGVHLDNIANAPYYTYGGGVFCRMSSPTIRYNVFRSLSAEKGSAVACLSGAAPRIEANRLESVGSHGSIATEPAIYAMDSNPQILDNTITGTLGTAIECEGDSAPHIEGNTITGSTFCGISCLPRSAPAIERNTIHGTNGTAIRCEGSGGYIRNNVIVDNAGDFGVAIQCINASPQIINNTLSGNTGIYRGQLILDRSSPAIANNIIAFGEQEILADSLSHPDVRANCFFGNVRSYYGSSIKTLRADPLFTDRTAGDYRLQPASPCHDDGLDAFVLPFDRDRDGGPRRLGSHVDIGAFETPVPGTYGLDDVAAALRASSGLSVTDTAVITRLDVFKPDPLSHCVDLRDAILLIRKAAGLEPNP